MRKKKATESALSLDPFLDVVTNTLGMLVLIAALVILGHRDMRINLGTPIMVKADKNLKRVEFECRDNRTIFLDSDFQDARLKRIFKLDLSEIRDRLEALSSSRRTNTNGYHYFEWEIVRVGPTTYGLKVAIPSRDERVGDWILDLAKSDSEFLTRLDELDPKKHWIYFIVRENSFEALRLARKLARQRGFKIGWRPKKNYEDIVFDPRGKGGTEVDK